LNEVLRAQEILDQKYGVAADVWSVTSYKALYTDGIETERWNRLHPTQKPHVPYVTQCVGDAQGVIVAATDYLKTLPNMISKWVPRRMRRSEQTALAGAKARVLARFLRGGCEVHHACHAA